MTKNMSYKKVLKNHRKKHYKKHYKKYSKTNLITLGNKNNGLECDKFDDIINEDLYFFLTFDNIPELKKSKAFITFNKELIDATMTIAIRDSSSLLII